ncbi:5-(carboxyamino)imidazole ribonucleotide synthase [Sphingomonas oleivorans]|uniref:N5-carboxyaminoimidazole ribonucleotide synthase n=1 Tax=Sphingomonas oleivorans TaxID=1735121 RepID=A0A2T5FXD4_9SPHN|nr:5-(carboxyamino)imidazole ribonucleotide synthase [Sphingomonas oleivorans]PTQ10744.1 5-(carboxyamino)imidazole ribonucleotide synthase [Sphingomonas oleivorans]
MKPVPPGSTIGILGGGQLGRMLAMAAANLGYRCHIYAPEPSGPASEVSAAWTQGRYDDDAALAAFAARVDVVTYEFENVDAAALVRLGAAGGCTPIHPTPRALEVAQDRLNEKDFVTGLGGRTAPYRAIDSLDGLKEALAAIGTPAILKTRRMGYDGKGQARIMHPDDAGAAWEAIGGAPAILEGFVAFDREYSILLARGADGETALWDPVTNFHAAGILDLSTVPSSGIVLDQLGEASALARRIADALGYVGVMAFEFFAGAEGPVFNEMAPRVHNSGHWTIEGAITSQFENHIRAVCGLPLGSTALAANRVEMRNLIGAAANDWLSILAERSAHLHLYGKGDPRPGRKMGHVTRLFFD